MNKRILPLLLVVVLLLGMLPASALGAAQDKSSFTCGKEGHVHTAACFTVGTCTGLHTTKEAHTLACFRTVCEKDHVHEESCYDLSGCPAYGKEGYHVHEFSCLSESDKALMRKADLGGFAIVASGAANNKALEAELPWVFVKSGSYEVGVHSFYKAHVTPPEGTRAQLFAVANIEGLKAGQRWEPRYKGEIDYTTPFDPRHASDFNYVVCYCCDTYVDAGNEANPYRQVNLENSSYFSRAVAEQLRTVMYNGYPYLSVEELQKRMKAAGVPDADKMDSPVLLGATQLAIWHLAASEDKPAALDDFYYWYRARSTINAGLTAHNEKYANTALKTDTIYFPNADRRMRDAAEYFLTLAKAKPMSASDNNTVITGVEVTDLFTSPRSVDGTCTISFRVKLNAPYVSQDGSFIRIVASSGDAETDNAVASVDADSSAAYEMVLENYRMGDPIDFTLDGVQHMGYDVFFYEGKPTGDKDVRYSVQNLIGWAAGPIPVKDRMTIAPTELTLRKVDEKGEPLGPATFRLSYLRNDQPEQEMYIGEYTTEAGGTLLLDMLMPGATYKLEELVAPKGYSLLKEPVYFTVEGTREASVRIISGQAAMEEGDLLIINKPDVPPETGDHAQPLVWAVTLALLLAAALLLRRRMLRA